MQDIELPRVQSRQLCDQGHAPLPSRVKTHVLIPSVSPPRRIQSASASLSSSQIPHIRRRLCLLLNHHSIQLNHLFQYRIPFFAKS